MITKKKKEPVGELIFGIHPIIEVLKARRRKIVTIYTTRPEPKGWKTIQQSMGAYKIPIQYVSRDILTKMAGGTTDHQGFVAWVKEFPFRKKPFDPKREPFIVLLDGMQDPHNVGAVIRSAYCTGAQGVILTKKQGAPLSASALKASAGLAEHLEIMITPTAPMALEILKKAGYSVYIAAFGGKDATTMSYTQPVCLVIGGEGFGVTQAAMQLGTKITIPQRTPDISYNASVAAGILMFVVSNQIGALANKEVSVSQTIGK